MFWLEEALLEIGGVAAEGEPIREDRRIMQPDREPLRDFHREIFVRGFSTGCQHLEFVFQLKHGLTQMFERGLIKFKLLAQIFDLVHQNRRAMERAERQVVRSKERVTFTPLHVGFENLWMAESNAMIRKRARNCSGTHRRPKTLQQRLLNQTQLGSARNLFIHSLPNVDDVFVSVGQRDLFLDFLDESQRVVPRDQRDVFVSAEILQKREQLARV